ncbi:MAG: hypothetical protein NTNFB02_33000 [Nitrospira sp.]
MLEMSIGCQDRQAVLHGTRRDPKSVGRDWRTDLLQSVEYYRVPFRGVLIDGDDVNTGRSKKFREGCFVLD